MSDEVELVQVDAFTVVSRPKAPDAKPQPPAASPSPAKAEPKPKVVKRGREP